MRARNQILRRLILLAGIAAGPLLAATDSVAASANDVGSWGQAWGDEDVAPVPQQQPQRRAQVPAATNSLPTAVIQTPSAVPQSAPSAATRASDIGGWGDAWGNGSAAAPAQAARPASSNAMSAPASTMPRSSGPNAADIGGWGQAWNGDSRSAAPPPARSVPSAQTVAVASPPVTAAAPNAAMQATPVSVAPSQSAARSVPVDAPDDEQPVSLTADQIVHDRELGIVTARGKVEIIQSGRTLIADQVNYNLKQDIISASGNVLLIEATGDVMETNYFELTGDLREGVAKEILTILADNSRLTATSARRVAGNRTDLENGTYTACEPCRNNPSKKPLWQLKAKQVTHDQQEHQIEYRDAWIELGGIPIAYTPYISHPDPSVKRKSGFLAPSAGTSSNLGVNVTVPYFWAIKDNQDITFSPRFLFPGTAKNADFDDAEEQVLRRIVLSGEHRWVGQNGETKTQISFTQDRHNGDNRGHIDARGRFDLDNSWRAGYQIERASDDTYNSVYSFPIQADRPWLTTRPYVEGFSRRGYTRAEAFAFQGLRNTDDPGESPIVLPHITSNQISVPDSHGGYYTFDNDFLSYFRSEGTSATRMSSQAGWNRPFMGRMGDVTTLSTSLRADAYHAEEVTAYGSTNAGRVVPLVSANWRMPFVRESRSLPQVIEPMVMVAASPNGGNSSKIPNEDSIGFELDETNIFRANRMPGLDRVEGGVRGAYGLRWQAYPSRGGWVAATLAQGWRARKDSTFREGSGFEENLSDYLGRLDIAPSSNFALYNRVRIDKDSGNIRRNENTLSMGSPLLRTDVTYLMLDKSQDEDASYPRRHYVSWDVSSALTRHWSASAGVRYDLVDAADPIGWKARLYYDDECFTFVTTMKQDYTYDRDDLGGFAVSMTVVFKTLGEVPFNLF